MSGRNSEAERRVFQAARSGLDLEMNGRELANSIASEIEASQVLEAKRQLSGPMRVSEPELGRCVGEQVWLGTCFNDRLKEQDDSDQTGPSGAGESPCAGDAVPAESPNPEANARCRLIRLKATTQRHLYLTTRVTEPDRPRCV